MDFTFSGEQRELQRALRELAVDHATSADVRRAMAGPAGYDPALWSVVATEMGLAGVGVDESAGGTGGGFVDLAVVVEEAGRALLPVPLLSSLVAAQVLARCPGRPADVLSAVAAGASMAAVAVGEGVGHDGDVVRGEVPNVLDGHLADVVVLVTPAGVWVVPASAPGVTVTPVATLDPTRRQATLSLDGVGATRAGDAAAAAAAVDLLRVALAVEAVGCARRCLELTVEHLKTREQFGRPIGSFQALQHRAADLVVQVESAASTAYYAAWAAQDSPDELPVVAPLAKAVCLDAAWHVAAETIQMHGGIGFTWEHDAHLYFKRLTTTRLLLGDSHEQRRLVAARANLGGR